MYIDVVSDYADWIEVLRNVCALSVAVELCLQLMILQY
jgi:hypothetical protein